ncbi:hypothetical protein BC829DRAFT_444451 [Chytridium lagenaria]|nr:hypothetical protein BC829DRAFT_444451 [Chytridium lagenaria]
MVKKLKTEPKSKQQQETEDVATQAVLEELLDVNTSIETLEEELEAEKEKLDTLFDEKRKPLLAQRDKISEKIDDFWSTAFLVHPIFSMAVPEAEKEIIQHLKQFKVEEPSEKTIKLTFKFAKNDFFSNTELVLAVVKGELTFPKINWKPNKNPNEKKPTPDAAVGKKRKHVHNHAEGEACDDDHNLSFFSWLGGLEKDDDDEDDEAHDFLALLIEDLYPNAVDYYVKATLGESDDEGMDDEFDE